MKGLYTAYTQILHYIMYTSHVLALHRLPDRELEAILYKLDLVSSIQL